MVASCCWLPLIPRKVVVDLALDISFEVAFAALQCEANPCHSFCHRLRSTLS